MCRNRWLLICWFLLLPLWAAAQTADLQRLERADAKLAPTNAGPTAEEGREALAAVLARAEFGTVRTTKMAPWMPKWLTKFFRDTRTAMKKAGGKVSSGWKRMTGAISRFFQRIFGKWNPGGGERTNSGMRYTIHVLVILVVLLLIGFMVSRLLIYWQHPDREKRRSGGKAPEESPRGKVYVTPWEQAINEAQACWNDGNQREALRLVMRASLLLLDQRGVLRFDETRANGEVLRELRRLGRGDMHGEMRVIVRAFDRGWYGFLDISHDEFTTVVDTSNKLRTLVTEDR